MNTKFKTEKRIIKIARKCLAFVGIWVQLSQTLTATNLVAFYFVRHNTEKGCSSGGSRIFETGFQLEKTLAQIEFSEDPKKGHQHSYSSLSSLSYIITR